MNFSTYGMMNACSNTIYGHNYENNFTDNLQVQLGKSDVAMGQGSSAFPVFFSNGREIINS